MNVAFQKYRMKLALGGPDATRLVVLYPYQTGGTIDAPTGAVQGGVRTLCSGVLPGFVSEQPALSVVRQHAEVQAGDLIIDVDPEAPVALFDGQMESGVRALDTMDEPIFVLHGRQYVQKQAGGKLAQIWDATLASQRMERTLHLTLRR